MSDSDFCIRWGVPSVNIASSLDPTAIEFPDHDIQEKMGGGRLTEDQLEEIWQMKKEGKSQNKIAQKLHVSGAMISMILNGKRRVKSKCQSGQTQI